MLRSKFCRLKHRNRFACARLIQCPTGFVIRSKGLVARRFLHLFIMLITITCVLVTHAKAVRPITTFTLIDTYVCRAISVVYPSLGNY